METGVAEVQNSNKTVVDNITGMHCILSTRNISVIIQKLVWLAFKDFRLSLSVLKEGFQMETYEMTT